MGPRIPWGRSHALDVLYVARLRGSGFDPPAQAGGFFRRQGIGSILGFLWPWEGEGRGQEVPMAIVEGAKEFAWPSNRNDLR